MTAQISTGHGRPGTHDDAPSGPAWSVRLLGSFSVTGPDGLVHLTAREQRVVAYLGLHGARARAVVAGALWPETDEIRARQNLRAAVSTLSRVAPGLVRCVRTSLELDASVDVRTLVAAAQAVLRAAAARDDGTTDAADGSTDGGPDGPADRTRDGRASLVALGGSFLGDGPLAPDLLPGWYEDWVLVESERLRHLRLHALEELSALLTDAARYGLALEAALAAVALDPLRESAIRAVMEVHAREGNVATALATHERFKARLARELRIAPSPHLEALVARLRRCEGTEPVPGRRTWQHTQHDPSRPQAAPRRPR